METVSEPDRSRIRTLQVESCEQTREILDEIFSSLFERIYIYIFFQREMKKFHPKFHGSVHIAGYIYISSNVKMIERSTLIMFLEP